MAKRRNNAQAAEASAATVGYVLPKDYARPALHKMNLAIRGIDGQIAQARVV